MNFKVTIEETLSREIEIEADSKMNANDRAMHLYFRGDIVLDSGDFVGVDFHVEEKESN